jgi:hypothetical protein
MAIIMKRSDLEEEAPPEAKLLFAITFYPPLGVLSRHARDKDTGDTMRQPIKMSRASWVTEKPADKNPFPKLTVSENALADPARRTRPRGKRGRALLSGTHWITGSEA